MKTRLSHIEQLQKAHKTLLEIGLNIQPLTNLAEVASPDIMGFGTTIDERIFSLDDLRALIQRQAEQSEGMEMHWDIKTCCQKIAKNEHVAFFADDVTCRINMNGELIEMQFRYSSVFEFRADKWLAIHFHGSKPELVETATDTYSVQKWKQKAETLEKMVAERTAELQEKNRELEIEAALERVRSRSLAMHKSDELQDVVNITFEKLKELGVVLDTSVTIKIISEDSKDFVYWVATPDIVSSATSHWFPHFDHPICNDFLIAKENGLDYFAKAYPFEIKNKFFQHIFEHSDYRTIADEVKKIILEKDSYAWSIAFYKHSGIFVDSISGKLLAEQEAEILKRFAKVFEQAYIRFLDLQKAETQARESQIQLALERVRARTMAMHKSDELSEAAGLLFQQIGFLGIKSYATGFTVWENNDKDLVSWMCNADGSINPPFRMPASDIEWHRQQYKSWKNKEEYIIHDFTGNDMQQHYAYLRSFPLLNEAFKQSEAAGVATPERQVHNVFNFSNGNLLFITLQPVPEAHELFTRFANVFEQTYTRFLDLQKAEAQAREAQIEIGLERVRSRAMSMQSSDELKMLIGTLFTELTKLDLTLTRCIIWIFEQDTNDARWWMANSEDAENPASFYIQYHNYPAYLAFVDAWKKQTVKFVYDLKGQDKIQWDTILFNETELKKLPDFVKNGMRASQQIILSGSFNNFGGIHVSSNQPLSAEHFDILLRFAKVFDQTYTRFLDLQKAEINEREAIRQASLDRVRAEIASMRTKDDLQRITPLIWKELTTLTVPFIRCGVFIMDEATEKVHTYLSTPDGRAIASFDLPYTNPGITPEVVTHWRNRQIFSDHWDEAQFRAWSQSLVEQGLIQSDKSYMSEAPPQQLSLYFLPFQQGMLYVGNKAPLTNDEIKLAQVLADAFSTAYARYQDFNELEETKLQVEKAFSELKSTQTQLIQKEKLASLGELTAGIAHEIQNPLNFVNNFSELSVELAKELKVERLKVKEERDDELENELVDDLIQNQEKINLHGKRASSIVKGMLEHSRQSTGKRELTDINQLADEYLRLSYHGLRAKDSSFNSDYELITDKNLPTIEVVPQEIGRVLLNLINNAFYAVYERAKQGEPHYQPKVRVTTKTSDNHLEIRVQDNGNGIPDTIKSKIFQPFFTTKPTGEGTGLGLSLAYDIVTKGHGGTMEVESVEGEGTEFVISLPT